MTERIAVLGLDCSFKGFGYALGCEGLPVHEGWKATDAARGPRARVERYLALCEPALELARQYGPRAALLEDYAFRQNGGQARYLAEMRGVLLRELLKSCDNVIEVGNSALRKYATGYGGREKYPAGLDEKQLAAQKRQRSKDGKTAVAEGLRQLYGRPFDQSEEGWHDRADAHTLARLGLALCEVEPMRTDAQREVVAALRAKAAA